MRGSLRPPPIVSMVSSLLALKGSLQIPEFHSNPKSPTYSVHTNKCGCLTSPSGRRLAPITHITAVWPLRALEGLERTYRALKGALKGLIRPLRAL